MVVITNAQSSDEEGTMGVDVEVISSNDDEQMDADEGEVTEQQKKVAEAAGLGEQITGKDNKKTRSEKKARKLFSKLGLKPVLGIVKVCIRKTDILFTINKPDVYKSPGSDTYIVFGEAKVDDLRQMGKFSDIEAFKPQQPSQPFRILTMPNNGAGEENDAEPEEDPGDIEERDIELVMQQSGVSRSKAIRTLKNTNNDLVNAIMELTM
uniref:NAC-A/B domain-containing protein n=2 Tax=Acrobeloides nanus TaxID=290746 RepID=A0A914DQR9_9BILA